MRLRRRPGARPPGAQPLRPRPSAGPVPTHPVATPDPQVLRWVVPDGLLTFTGPAEQVPGRLEALREEGTLAGIVVEPGAVLTLLGPERTWQEEGARVRSALVDALATPARWRPAPGSTQLGSDDVLAQAAQQVAAGPVGALAASHGGSIEVASVRDGVVEVAMSGACQDCPAALVTMRARFEHLLRRRCPWLVEVRQVR